MVKVEDRFRFNDVRDSEQSKTKRMMLEAKETERNARLTECIAAQCPVSKECPVIR